MSKQISVFTVIIITTCNNYWHDSGIKELEKLSKFVVFYAYVEKLMIGTFLLTQSVIGHWS